MKRREFLTGYGSALLASSIGLSLAATARSATTSLPPLSGPLGEEQFTAYINQHFWVHNQNRQSELTLVAVTEGTPRPKHKEVSLTFAGPETESLDAGTYNFEHASSGRFQLYLEPAGQGPQGLYYRADFSLLN
jgi:hypothetical protein